MHAASRPHHQDALLRKHLQAFFGDAPPDLIERVQAEFAWVDLRGGETLIRQGDDGDALYLLVSGRLRAYRVDGEGAERMLREIPRGEIVGEMSLFTNEPRSATVVAVRDSVVARLDKQAFERLLDRSGQVSVALTRQIIRRLRTEGAALASNRPVTMGLLPISAGLDVTDFAQRLARSLSSVGRVCVVDARAVERGDGPSTQEHVAAVLDEIEAAHDFVLLVADDGPTDWTSHCSRHADELLLLADAQAAPQLHPTETQLLEQRPERWEATEILVLLHPGNADTPRNTAAWLARRQVHDHLHLRPDLDRDMARLARIQSRTAVGLVLAGGGARGFAHLGVYRALKEKGIEVDYVGGTSMGAVMALYVASDRPLDTITDNARRSFRLNPTGDFNLLPLLSLIKGERLRRICQSAVGELVGADANVEDLWLNYFCITTNYSRASEHVVRRGNIVKSLLASVAIPGALPPVLHEGDLYCDGGTFNNFPVDVMARMRGVGRIIGVDLSNSSRRPIELEELPSAWGLLRDRLRGRRRRRYRLPSLASYLMNVTILYSASRQAQARAQTDLYFNPPLYRVGMLQWSRFEPIAQQGYAHALEVLGKLPQERLDALQRISTGGAAGVPRPDSSEAVSPIRPA